eukprot:4011431-Heterocapsa_arctica.AAC.1
MLMLLPAHQASAAAAVAALKEQEEKNKDELVAPATPPGSPPVRPQVARWLDDEHIDTRYEYSDWQPDSSDEDRGRGCKEGREGLMECGEGSRKVAWQMF